MGSRNIHLFSSLIFISLVGGEAEMLHRDKFPPSFVFGVSTSAYQCQGESQCSSAFCFHGFSMKEQQMKMAKGKEFGTPSHIKVMWLMAAQVTFHRTGITDTRGFLLGLFILLQEDVKHLSETGFDAFRFSISWSRLVPDGRGAVNPKGLEYYNNLINELLDKGIEPYVTLHHFDLPQKLEDEYGGWLSPKIVEDFLAFSEICFREFGNRVQKWITINEPNVLAQMGYSEGMMAPKRCSIPEMHCTAGNSSTEPYLALHNMLIAHSAVVKLYRDKYQKYQKGSIGLSILAYWYWPLTNSTADILAWQRALNFTIGWVLEPLLHEQYPKIMQEIVGTRLPRFTESQKKDLKNSFDFVALSHYSTLYVYNGANISEPTSYVDDVGVLTKAAAEDSALPAKENMAFGSVPLGFEDLLLHVKARYGNPPVLVTECGYPEVNVKGQLLSKALNDSARVSYFRDYIKHMHNAISKGSNVKGFLAWTLVDGFEYAMGYKLRFGIYYVDKDLHRYPKNSARWFERFLKRGKLNMPPSSVASY